MYMSSKQTPSIMLKIAQNDLIQEHAMTRFICLQKTRSSLRDFKAMQFYFHTILYYVEQMKNLIKTNLLF